MNIEKDIFRTYSPDFKKLKEYGFKKNKDTYFIKKSFMNGEFIAKICVTESCAVSGKVFDSENNEEYMLLRLENAQGAFVGEVKAGYENILYDIREKCFIKKFFITNQANRISEIILEKYGDNPVFMWEKYPTFGVFKNHKNDKWYGLIMYISGNKLGEPINEMVEVINLKLDKNKIPELIHRHGFYPAYHMNKKYWISIVLDNSISDIELLALIDESYGYTIKTSKNV